MHVIKIAKEKENAGGNTGGNVEVEYKNLL